MLADVWLVTNKDLRIEWRSRVTFNQVVPFALIVLVLFGFALDTNRAVLQAATSGVFWLTVLFVAVVAVTRSTMIEIADGARRALLLVGIEPVAVYFGKTLAIAIQLFGVELLMVGGVIFFFDATVESWPLLFATCLVATWCVAASGTLLGALVANVAARDTVLPILLLPVLAPVLIAASRAFDDALGVLVVDGWVWLGLLAAFGIVNATLGTLAYGTLLEEA